MLFNSIDFAIFLPIVFVLYWFVVRKNLTLQNGLIVVASYVFYGWWDWRFLSLIFVSTTVDFLIGIALSRQDQIPKRKLLLYTAVGFNLGLLGFFKYYNFFLENFAAAFSFFGRDLEPNTLRFILPVGISFYTFQTMSYSIDVYRRKMVATHNFVDFAAFVSFFPQLVAGPIERATHLLPQFQRPRVFDEVKAAEGMRQILWGVFKKVVIADNCAQYADLIFDHSADYSGIVLWLGTVFFAIQIYADFSGYSDIALGVARLFGFELMQNFAFPYFSRNVAEFWRRWHISLTSWFRDYVYIPLGGSRVGPTRRIRNIFLVFLLSGFWHGPKWTFVIWGAINALYVVLNLQFIKPGKDREASTGNNNLSTLREFVQIAVTFNLICLAWIFFRAVSLPAAMTYTYAMFTGLFQKTSLMQGIDFLTTQVGLHIAILLLLFFAVEWMGRTRPFAMSAVANLPRSVRLACYYTIVVIIFVYGGKEQAFIYFQF